VHGDPPADLVDLGAVRGAWGVRGWARIAPYAADAQVLRAARTWWLVGGETPQRLEVTACRRHSTGLVAKWDGCERPEDAEALKGRAVAVARSEFPASEPGEYYWVDLLGARVVNRQGDALGIVSGLRNNGAHDLLEVTSKGVDGAQRLVPMVAAYVDEVDADGRLIRVDWRADW
jgi:16S rRNA processing protein RimM